jgi:hypothetical protein
MEPKYKPILAMIKFRAKVRYLILMDLSILDHFLKDRKMVKVFISHNLKNMKVSGNKIVNKV